MKNITKFFIFILDELILISIIIMVMWYLQVSIELFLFIIVLILLALGFISYVFIPQLKKPMTGSEGLIGEKGKALESFDKKGSVLVHGERWNAILDEGYIEKDDEVIVQEIQGLTIIVKKI